MRYGLVTAPATSWPPGHSLDRQWLWLAFGTRTRYGRPQPPQRPELDEDRPVLRASITDRRGDRLRCVFLLDPSAPGVA